MTIISKTVDTMNKRILAITACILIMMSAKAQIFLDDDDAYNNRVAAGTSAFFIENPGEYGSGEDWYVPIDGGAIILSGIACVYYLKKRRKNS